jgi:Mrp family chromosome partitioning ATPase
VPVPAPTASAFDFSLDDGIDLGSPLSPPSSVAAAPADAGISLGALDGGNFELELGDAGEPPSFEVDFSTNRPRSFEPPATEAFEVNFSANPSQRFGGAAATTAEGDTGFVNLRQTDAGFARPRSDEGFARPRASDGFARPLQTDDGFARPRMNDAPAFASAAPLATLGHDRTETMAALGLDDARPQEIGHAGTQPILANVDALDAASTSLHNPVFTTLVAAARELGASDLHIAAARVTSTAGPGGGGVGLAAALRSPELCARSTARVVALVGPTGVGKTTTIAKLAARAALVEKRRVAIVTLDTCRVGGEEPLRAFADLMGGPLFVAGADDLPAKLERLRACDRVFIDTAGRSPRDAAALGELERLDALAHEVEVHHTLPAATPPAAVERTVQRYRGLSPRRLLFTKLDEADDLASLALAPARTGLPVTWIATGQRVPEDLEDASPDRLGQLVTTGFAPQGEDNA